MSERAMQIAQELLLLPTEDRASLASMLIESLETPADGGEVDERIVAIALERAADLASGRDPGIPHAEVMAAARRRLP